MNLLECDVHLTKDKVVVVAHDAGLERMCGPEYKDKTVNMYNYEELPKF